MYMKHLYLIIFTALTLSCQKNTDSASTTTYFGGQIINPNDDYVLLFKDDVLIDSIILDTNNRFLLQIDSLVPGLYNFKHKPEYQYIYFEPGDSILIRLNTLEFDESLVFSGKGSEKNNFLIDSFIENENEEGLMYDLYDLSPDDFEKAIDSLHNRRLNKYNTFLLNNKLSQNSRELIAAGIDYPFYTAKEVYPFMHKNKWGKPTMNELPDSFYGFRKEVDFNNENLSHFRLYINYMTFYFNNLSYEMCQKKCNEEILEKSLHYNIHKLALIDSVIAVDDIKNLLFRNTAYSYLFSNHAHLNDEKFLKYFFQYSTDQKHDKEIDNLYHNIQNVQKGRVLPTIYLYNANGDSVNIHKTSLATKGTVYYFWSIYRQRHFRSLMKKIPLLREKYPEINFVGININDEPEKWLGLINLHNFDRENQYRTTNFNKMREILVMPTINKTIITDSKGRIVNAFANIYDATFEKQLGAFVATGKSFVYK